ncbi:hypothetical protein E4U43_002184 [Claviceps pusilla]|uniref:Uncharacterized protein n=1 Tax=Claviceps pusilla TaxID=123648 RepID=A0A9P7SXP6_9HYPO|nr:hypothetical protein E4U43_002184 [Claviceps pusilla]
MDDEFMSLQASRHVISMSQVSSKQGTSVVEYGQRHLYGPDPEGEYPRFEMRDVVLLVRHLSHFGYKALLRAR